MIKLVLFDIDGVLTDGKVLVDSAGNEWKSINFKDFDAISEMKKLGLKIGFLTGESSPITLIFKKRFQPDFFYNGCKDKIAALKKILRRTNLSADQICYVGDGKYDLSVMKLVKYKACPADAISEIKNVSNIQLKTKGGDGCCWELLQWFLEQGAFDKRVVN